MSLGDTRQASVHAVTVAGYKQIQSDIPSFQHSLFSADSSEAPKSPLVIGWALYPSLHHSL